MLLEVDNVSTQYHTHRGIIRAVDGVSFELREGECLGLAGESASGKSTLALTILRLLPSNAAVTNGAIHLNGQDILHMRREEFRRQMRWKKISVIFQGSMNALNPIFRVGDQIAEAIMAHEEVHKAEAWDRAVKLLQLVNIDPVRATNYPHELSGGMKQRVVIAMSLACNPELLIADEPVTALDVITQAQITNLLRELQRRLRLSMIFITHDLSLLAKISDRCAIMYAGRIFENAEIRQIFRKPLHPYTQGLLRSFPDPKADRWELEYIAGDPPDPVRVPPGCSFHPRCPHAQPVCSQKVPSLRVLEPGHVSACHFSEKFLGS